MGFFYEHRIMIDQFVSLFRRIPTVLPLLLLVGVTGWSQVDPIVLGSDSALSVQVRIESHPINDGTIFDTLAVTLDSTACEISAFDLKLGCSDEFVSIVEILPGDFADSCGWEFFQARRIPPRGNPDLPGELWQAIALAELVPDSTRPSCYRFDRDAVLIRLVVTSGTGVSVPDTTVPIFFLWEDCTDNTISDRSGNLLMLSSSVHDDLGTVTESGQLESSSSFPTRSGTPSACIRGDQSNRPVRMIEFHNGTLKFKFDLGHSPLE